MEDVQTQDQVAQAGPVQSQSFTTSQKPKKSSSSKWLIIFIILLIIGGAGIYFFTKSGSAPIATPTPSFGVVPIEDSMNEVPTATPTASPEAVDKEKVTIDVQNGTGVPGEAAYLQGKLKTIGYSDIDAGNASSSDNQDTQLTFSKSLSQTVQDEIKKLLDSTYKSVTVKTSSTQDYDVVIITGLRGSQTSKPEVTSSSKVSSSPSASPSASPSI